MKILLIGHYPIGNPRHGGQLRARAIHDAYVSRGHKVKYCAIAPKSWYPDLKTDDIDVGDNFLKTEADKLSPDLALAKSASSDRIVKKHLTTLIEFMAPDVIELEQPFTFLAIYTVLKNLKWAGKLVYSSQNIEYKLRASMLENSASSSIVRETVVAAVKQIEAKLIKSSDLVTACTEADRVELISMGAKKVILARNGIHARTIIPANVREWERRYRDGGVKKILFFVGSEHAPNLQGFECLVGYRLGFIPKDVRIVVAGGVCKLINLALLDQPQHIAATFRLRADLLGSVSDEDIASLLAIAHGVLLPITQGGGSNLKTAEAILSGKPIIATRMAFRGYEKYKNLSGVSFSDTTDKFHSAITKVVSNEHSDPIKKEIKTRESVTWEHVLGDMVQEVEKITE